MPAVKLKRMPVQGRSTDTVQHILDATSGLLEKEPLEQITTSRVAAEAGVSIGGLYRFFPDKQALIDAIAVRRVEEFQREVERHLAGMDRVDGPALLSAMVDLYVDFLDQHADFRTIALGHHFSELTKERQVEDQAGPAAMVKMFLLEGADVKIGVAIEAGERLIDYAFAQPTVEQRTKVIGEMKRMLTMYLFT
jgi:AcrR family transcriptional regulator